MPGSDVIDNETFVRAGLHRWTDLNARHCPCPDCDRTNYLIHDETFLHSAVTVTRIEST
ncbi:hypothetical protein KB1_12140 [Cutibacterium modestum]|jgi:hypothetical protein|uniref:Uncharacterized protein n=1 Tax=Cutibacterium modestum TaxID=2559073 RepID=A0AAD1NW06_9ACTN|nr:hypothetical protein KB1_12140 [Cutibacterium modestum]